MYEFETNAPARVALKYIYFFRTMNFLYSAEWHRSEPILTILSWKRHHVLWGAPVRWMFVCILKNNNNTILKKYISLYLTPALAVAMESFFNPYYTLKSIVFLAFFPRFSSASPFPISGSFYVDSAWQKRLFFFSSSSYFPSPWVALFYDLLLLNVMCT